MSGKFEPKAPVSLNPPKNEPISLEELAKANGIYESFPCQFLPITSQCSVDGAKGYVAIKGKVYDVTGNKAYQPGGAYHVFVGKDASRALGMMSTKANDVDADWSTLDDKEKIVLDDWITFFSKRYNIVGVVEGATNMD
ncbi:hypothetical protein DCS_01411 [Drechmeria coniospora]|uniref:Cytochrome b5 heme-binding domain-containing protein n=1 Tax=Drechmeria coniospora TaxID=98403 RepID=A0A151GT25_DRECN|nr:hypothetical protein DCS_01411 [Drechmeria coniospora]KYK60274.1 hypothetical protein DCS_01411 [Drechmeria coniospora]